MSGINLHGIGMTSQRTRDRLVARLRERGIRDERVLQVMGKVPRHLFVDEALATRAYEDTALPIGHGQTISQPYIVARMTEILLAEGLPGKVLEVGTGSGYQSAVLSELVPQVYSVERILALHERARRVARELDIRNLRLRHSDGTMGWPECGPFDGVIVTAAAEQVPESLLVQLAIGGRMVIPVACEGGQELVYITRDTNHFERVSLERVSFVPFLPGAVR